MCIKDYLQTEDKGIGPLIVETMASCYLWVGWLQQDVSSFSVYVDRSLPMSVLIFTCIWIFLLLGLVAYTRGERVQTIVTQKFNASNIKECAIIDFTYGTILYYFKTLNKLPMSTTWTFLGLLAGRELGITFNDFTFDRLIKALKMMLIELLYLMIGLVISVVCKFLTSM
jgi:hypothetical protein